MRTSNVKALTEAGAMSSIAVITGLISVYLPLLGGISSMIWPVPITLLGVRHGYKWSILATVASGLMIGMLTDPVRAAKVLVLCPVGIVFGYVIRAGYSPFRAMFWGTLAAAVSLGASVALTIVLLGVNPFSLQYDAMEKGLDTAIAFYRTMGVAAEELAQLRATLLDSLKIMEILIPMSFIFTAVVTAYINYALTRQVLKRLGHAVGNFAPFRLWSMPRYVVYLVVLGWVLNYWGNRQSIDWLFRLGENLLVGGLMLAYIQGLAVINFLTDKYNLSRPVRGIILLLVGLTPPIPVYAGIVDLALDYRRLRAPRSS